MNRIRPSTIVDKVKDISLAQYQIYDHDHLVKAYRAHMKKFSRRVGQGKEHVPIQWANFINFTSWFYLTRHPFLRDNKGDFFMPFDPSNPDDLCPINPKTLICNWQRKIRSLKPRLAGRNSSYLYVEDYKTGIEHKFRFYEGFDLEYFKKILLEIYFEQFINLDILSNLDSVYDIDYFYQKAMERVAEIPRSTFNG